MSDGPGVKVHCTTVYHLQANGMCEQFHQSLEAALRAYLTGGNWVDHLPWDLLGLRSTELVLGRVSGEFLPSYPSPRFSRSGHLHKPWSLGVREGSAGFWCNVPSCR